MAAVCCAGQCRSGLWSNTVWDAEPEVKKDYGDWREIYLLLLSLSLEFLWPSRFSKQTMVIIQYSCHIYKPHHPKQDHMTELCLEDLP